VCVCVCVSEREGGHAGAEREGERERERGGARSYLLLGSAWELYSETTLVRDYKNL
jgi:hypothetical protein